MSKVKHLAAALGIAVAGLTIAASVAEAQERRPLRVIVQQRSYLDPGPMVPVGSLNRYASQHTYSSPVYSNQGEWYGEGTLPARVGAGPNPFGELGF